MEYFYEKILSFNYLPQFNKPQTEQWRVTQWHMPCEQKLWSKKRYATPFHSLIDLN